MKLEKRNLIGDIFTILIILVVVSLVGCKSNIPKELANKINQYYLFEMNDKWEFAYEMRSPSFRETIDKNYYIEKMTNDNAGWSLNKFEILDIKSYSDRVVVKIKFTESVPAKYKSEHQIPDNIEQLSFIDESEWIKVNNEWYCRDAGMRLHLPLNASID